MRVLFLGDVVGRVGRDAVIAELPGLRDRLALDFVVVNIENAAGGFGVTENICNAMLDAGADVLTSGNHIWDKREIITYIDEQPRLLRPLNYPENTPGRGANMYELGDGRRVMVINVMLRLFMDPLDDPFAAVERQIADISLGYGADFILVDMHGEASSEKMAMGHFLDGRTSLVVGTHTHVPTADHCILPHGTGYQTDAGMCGDYDSIIGMKKDAPIERFTRKMPGMRLEPADGEATICGVMVNTDDATGLTTRIAPLRLGGHLSTTLPAQAS